MYAVWWEFPGDASGREPNCQCKREEMWVQSLVGKIPWRRAWQPTSVVLPVESHGQRSWQARVRRVTKSRIRLKWLSTQAHAALYYNSSSLYRDGFRTGSCPQAVVAECLPSASKLMCSKLYTLGTECQSVELKVLCRNAKGQVSPQIY